MLGILAWMGAPIFYCRCKRRQLAGQVKERQIVVFSFDDGPGSRLTPVILDLLDQAGVKATFYLLGRNILGREALVRRMAAAGHEIGLHGYDHKNYWKTGPLATWKDMHRGREAVERALGRSKGTYSFRPPYGRLNLAGMLYVWWHRWPVAFWTLDLGDTWAAPHRTPDRIHAVATGKGGAVTLAHDFDRPDSSVDEMVLAFVRATLDYVKQSGLKTQTFSEFMTPQDVS